MTTEAGLTRLQPVQDAAALAANKATQAYSTARKYVPESVKPQLEKLESGAAPYVSKAEDVSAKLLQTVDAKVDAAVNQATETYNANASYLQQQLERQKEFHQKNLESYKEAREAYLKKVEESVEFLKANGLTGAARKAAEEVTARVAAARDAAVGAAGALLKQVHDAVERLLAYGPVHSAIETTRPTLDAAFARYLSLHDSVTATPQYKKTYDLANAVLGRAQATWFYNKAKENLYPVVAPYADPAYDAVTKSEAYQALVAHLAPRHVA